MSGDQPGVRGKQCNGIHGVYATRSGKLCAMWRLILLLCWAFSAHAAELPDPVRFSVRLELGDFAAARAWLAAGLPPDFEGERIGTGLMIGAWEGNLALMELFYAHGAQLEATNRFGETALMLAAWKNRKEAVRWLLSHGAAVHRPDHQWTALHYAAFAGHAEIVDLLLAAGADVNARSTNGSTVLMMAVREGHEALVERLLAAGADVGLANDYGEDAVAWAMRQGRFALARRLAGQQRFAALVEEKAAARPASPPRRSEPAPDAVEERLRQARLLEAEGKRDQALAAYREALTLLKTQEKKVGAPKTAPQAIVIRAERRAPQKQTLIFVAEEAAAQEADRLLEKAQRLDAQGRRREAIALYRQAAAAIRSGAVQSP